MSSDNITSVVTDITTTVVTAQNGTVSPFTHPVLSTIYKNWGFIYMSGRITASAMAIIWAGSLSSLRRPPSAAPPKKKKGKGKDEKEKDDTFTEGFSASDAILMPIMASVVLIGLYYLIKWMDDPDLLNKIIRGYMSIMSIASMGKFAADGLDFVTNLVFPSVWSDRRGMLYKIDGERRRRLLVGGDSPVITDRFDTSSPVPGPLSNIRLPRKVNDFLWTLRHLLEEEWTLRAALHGLGSTIVKLKLNDLLGFNIALGTIIAYYLTASSSLSNLLGTAFCYLTFSLMSPTSFGIGTAVLAGLFVYDIVMVFYTPFMITVATKLEVPIKLTFQNAKGHASILGLGDIVLPGIFIALALRFDLWRYYNSKIKLVPTELETEVENTTDQSSTLTHTQYRAVKVPYVNPQGQWGNRFWAQGITGFFKTPTATPALVVSAFPKTYFYMAMLGYFIGMFLTMTVLVIFQHGQPALLYLVPCVTGAVWLTGAVRGELDLLWKYTEDGTLDTQDVVVEVDGEGNVIREISKKEEEKTDKVDGKSKESEKQSKTTEEGYPVFYLSLVAPRQNGDKEE